MIVDIWADVVCPWCYIGHRRLGKAVAAFSHADEVVLRHRAFQLQPEIAITVPTSSLLATKYGISAEEVQAMQANVCLIAEGEGLCYALGETLSGNTTDAHRLLLWAQSQGKQQELLEAMFAAYFEKSLPLFSHADLLAITDLVGLDHEMAQTLLFSDLFRDEVAKDGEVARSLGATGVPFYVVDMRYGISGAQSQEVFAHALETAWNERQSV